jgi:hypothetical protein
MIVRGAAPDVAPLRISAVTPVPSVPTTADLPAVRVAGVIGRLVSVSATAAIVQTGHALPSDRVWRLSIPLESESLDVPVRVLRSQSVSIQLPHATWRHQEYLVALAFMDCPPPAVTQISAVPIGVDTPHVRIAGSLGRLVAASGTGAIVQVRDAVPTDRVSRLIINLGSEPLDVTVRVIQSQAVSIGLVNATWRRQEYLVALAFTAISMKAWAALDRWRQAGSAAGA